MIAIEMTSVRVSLERIVLHDGTPGKLLRALDPASGISVALPFEDAQWEQLLAQLSGIVIPEISPGKQNGSR